MIAVKLFPEMTNSAKIPIPMDAIHAEISILLNHCGKQNLITIFKKI